MRHLFCVLLAALPLTAAAQPSSLTESEAIRRGLARTEVSDLNNALVDAAQANALAARALPNPTLSYGRDKGRGSSTTTEETWLVSQSFDISGRRGLRQEAAEARVEAAYAGNTLRRGEWAAEIRRRFHEALLHQETARATQTWTERFARVESLVDKLSRAGEASGYDRRRLARERQSADARLQTTQGELERAKERLAALLGSAGQAPGTLLGELLPNTPVAMPDVASVLDQRPDLQALARRAEAADLEGRAAGRGWIPDVTLGVGPKQTDNGISRENATVMTVAIPLPVFDRQQAGQRRAAAEAMQARSEYGLAKSRAEGELRGLQRQLERLTAAAKSYRSKAVAETPELLRIAESAYRGGESSLLELLDAYRGALDTEITALELEWKARQARIEYDLLTGTVTQ
ncbi:TolC family protein [Ferribacterium limneticum]|uniref:TolC family protein n=1 Tax=Ferribacterium limneticum TaxID=76259 RepID=UPI001CF8A19A|nr:TolC family protein [Ferribacterium limneticum]UCV22323.1 TolC family protein [Ferribacterium limneticum]